MHFFKFFLTYKNKKKIYHYFVILFVLILFLFSLVLIFENYKMSFINMKKNFPYNLSHLYGASDQVLFELKKSDYVTSIYPLYNSTIKFNGNLYKLNYVNNNINSKLNLNNLKENEIIIQKGLQKKLGVYVDEYIDFIYKDRSISFKVVNVIDDIENFNEVIFTNYITIQNNNFLVEDNNYILIVNSFDDILILQEDNYNLAAYDASLYDVVEDYNFMLNIFGVIEKILIIFVIVLLLLFLKNLIDDERKEIAIYRVIGFSRFRVAIIYFFKILVFISIISFFAFVAYLLFIFIISFFNIFANDYNFYFSLFYKNLLLLFFIICFILVLVLLSFIKNNVIMDYFH